MMAFSSVIEPLRAANVLAKKQCYSWIIVGATKGQVEASNGVIIQPGFFVDDAPKVDRIVVCSGGDADHVVADNAVSWIRKNLRSGTHIGAVADAAFFLARAGLLIVMPAPFTGRAKLRSPRRSQLSNCDATFM